jgi:hypothetical protein
MHASDVVCELVVTHLTTAGLVIELVVKGRWGDRYTQLAELGVDRLDAPAQTIRTVAVALMLCDEPGDQCAGRSISAAKKADAAFKIALALRNSAFSRRTRFNSADSSVVVPGRAPASIWAWRTHLRTVSAVPIPSNPATSLIAAHSDLS